MVDKSIIDYIRRLRASGYDEGTIRSQLIRAGYDPRQVEQAFRGSSRAIPAKTIAILGGCLILAIILIIVVLKLIAPEPKFIEITLQPTLTELAPGEKLTFLKQITSDTERKARVQIFFIVTDSANKQVAQKQETLSVGKQLSTQTQIPLEELSQGQYKLTAIANYDGKSTTSQFVFTITESTAAPVTEPAEFDVPELECPQGCDDFDSCTQDACVKGVCQNSPVRPCCGNLVCEAGETKRNCPEDCLEREKTPEELIYQAGQLSSTDVQTAATVCKSLGKTAYADSCYTEVAIGSKKPDYCKEVLEEPTKDRCYLNFATKNNDYSTCSFIVNAYFSKSCTALSRASSVQA